MNTGRLTVLVLSGWLIAGCATRSPIVTITPGLHPQLQPAEAERIAREAISASIADQVGGTRLPDAVSITTIRGGSTIAAYEEGTSWLVEFDGWFEVGFGGRKGGTHIVRSAFVRVADDYGTVLSVEVGGPLVR